MVRAEHERARLVVGPEGRRNGPSRLVDDAHPGVALARDGVVERRLAGPVGGALGRAGLEGRLDGGEDAGAEAEERRQDDDEGRLGHHVLVCERCTRQGVFGCWIYSVRGRLGLAVNMLLPAGLGDRGRGRGCSKLGACTFLSPGVSRKATHSRSYHCDSADFLSGWLAFSYSFPLFTGTLRAMVPKAGIAS